MNTTASEQGELIGRLVVAWRGGGRESPDVQRLLREHPFLEDALRDMDSFESLLQSAGGDTQSVLTGTQVGDFLIEGLIGRGGMGEVWQAFDIRLRRRVAVKVLHAQRQSSEVARRRFIEESHIASQLQHPGIVPVHAMGSFDDGRPFLAMKLIEGRTLASLLCERALPSDDLPRFLAIFEQICQTIAYAHSRGIIHRDLKPGNVMVGAFGEVQVMDWGLARSLSDLPENAVPLDTPRGTDGSTWTNAAVGTFAYMAPEQAAGRFNEIDQRSDVYGLGAILCEILTGIPPGRRSTPAADSKLLSESADRAAALERLDACGADAELLHLAKSCLTEDRSLRPVDASEVSRRIAAHRENVAARLRQRELEAARRLESRKRRRVLYGFAVALLAALAFAAVSWRQRVLRDTERSARVADQNAAFDAELQRAAELRDVYRWTESEHSLAMAGQHLGDLADAERRQKLAQAVADLTLARRLDEVQIGKSRVIGRLMDWAWADGAYEAVFGELLDCKWGDDPETVGTRFRSSAVASHILAALDDWAVVAKDADRSEWILSIARAQDAGGSWNRYRHVSMWENKESMAELLADRAAKDVPASIYLMLARRGNLDHIAQRIQVLKIAHRRFEADFWVNLELGLALKRNSKYEHGIGFLRAAAAIRPRVPVVHANLGESLHMAGYTEESIEQLEQAVRIDPGYASAHYALGNSWQARADAMNVRSDGIRPISLVSAISLHCLSFHYRDLAIGAFERAIEIEPTHAMSLNNVANVYRQMGSHSKAIDYFLMSYRYDPNLPQPLINLAYLAQGPHREQVLNGLRPYPKADLIKRFSTLLGNAERSRRVETMAALYQMMNHLEPHEARYPFNLALTYRWQGRFAENIPWLKAGIRLEPRNPAGWYDLAVSYEQIGAYADAIAAFQTMISITEKPTPSGMEPWLPLVRLLRKEGRIAETFLFAACGMSALPEQHRHRDELKMLLGTGKQ